MNLPRSGANIQQVICIYWFVPFNAAHTIVSRVSSEKYLVQSLSNPRSFRAEQQSSSISISSFSPSETNRNEKTGSSKSNEDAVKHLHPHRKQWKDMLTYFLSVSKQPTPTATNNVINKAPLYTTPHPHPQSRFSINRSVPHRLTHESLEQKVSSTFDLRLTSLTV